MLEGGDRLGLRRVEAREEETRAVRKKGGLGRGGKGGAGSLEAGLGPEDPQLWCGAWRSRWLAGRGSWTRRRTPDGGSGIGLGCPREELCLPV